MIQSNDPSGTGGFGDSLKAAILAPAGNMVTIEDFESSFDAVRFHLEIAWSRTQSIEDKAIVQAVAQELFNLYIQVVGRMIVQARQGINADAIGKIRSGLSFADLAREYSLDKCIAIVALDTLSNSVTGFVQKLFLDHQLGRRTSKFYVQVARSYRKIVYSRIYSDKYGLINNAIDRQSADIIQGIIDLKEWDEGVEFVALLKSRTSFSSAGFEQTFIEGYRKSLMSGLKNIARFVQYAYINFALGFVLFILLVVLAFSGGSGAASFLLLLLMVADVYLLRYFWRYGPKIAAMRSRINQRVREISENKV